MLVRAISILIIATADAVGTQLGQPQHLEDGNASVREEQTHKETFWECDYWHNESDP